MGIFYSFVYASPVLLMLLCSLEYDTMPGKLRISMESLVVRSTTLTASMCSGPGIRGSSLSSVAWHVPGRRGLCASGQYDSLKNQSSGIWNKSLDTHPTLMSVLRLISCVSERAAFFCMA